MSALNKYNVTKRRKSLIDDLSYEYGFSQNTVAKKLGIHYPTEDEMRKLLGEAIKEYEEEERLKSRAIRDEFEKVLKTARKE